MALKDALEDERIRLFKRSIFDLNKELEELRDQFNVARNMACSEWESSHVDRRFFPNRILPETMALLHQNFDQLQTQISLRRYLIIKIYKPLIPRYCFTEDFCDFDVKANVAYWSRELKKKKPQIGRTDTKLTTGT